MEFAWEGIERSEKIHYAIQKYGGEAGGFRYNEEKTGCFYLCTACKLDVFGMVLI